MAEGSSAQFTVCDIEEGISSSYTHTHTHTHTRAGGAPTRLWEKKGEAEAAELRNLLFPVPQRLPGHHAALT